MQATQFRHCKDREDGVSPGEAEQERQAAPICWHQPLELGAVCSTTIAQCAIEQHQEAAPPNHSSAHLGTAPGSLWCSPASLWPGSTRGCPPPAPSWACRACNMVCRAVTSRRHIQHQQQNVLPATGSIITLSFRQVMQHGISSSSPPARPNHACRSCSQQSTMQRQ